MNAISLSYSNATFFRVPQDVYIPESMDVFSLETL